jgi:hypothetical protein
MEEELGNLRRIIKIKAESGMTEEEYERKRAARIRGVSSICRVDTPSDIPNINP